MAARSLATPRSPILIKWSAWIPMASWMKNTQALSSGIIWRFCARRRRRWNISPLPAYSVMMYRFMLCTNASLNLMMYGLSTDARMRICRGYRGFSPVGLAHQRARDAAKAGGVANRAGAGRGTAQVGAGGRRGQRKRRQRSAPTSLTASSRSFWVIFCVLICFIA